MKKATKCSEARASHAFYEHARATGDMVPLEERHIAYRCTHCKARIRLYEDGRTEYVSPEGK